MAGGEDEALDRAAADERQVVRGARPQACDRPGQLHLGDVGKDAVGLAQQLVDAAGGDRGVEAALFLGRADDQATILARHQVGALGGDDAAAAGGPSSRGRSSTTSPFTGRTGGRASEGNHAVCPDHAPLHSTTVSA